MADKGLTKGTDAFDTRLKVLERGDASRLEAAAAVAVYERTRTAMAICQALLPKVTDSAVVALVVELGKEVVQASQATCDKA